MEESIGDGIESSHRSPSYLARLCRRALDANLGSEIANLLLVLPPLDLPLLLGVAEFVLLRVEGQLALDERLSLLFDLGLTGGGPVAYARFELRQLAVLLADPLTKLHQLLLAAGKLLLLDTILLGQFQPQMCDGLRRFGRRQRARDLSPKLLGQQPCLQS